MSISENIQNSAIENSFPIAFISRLAERESWRKELYHPPYYIHKWWARRLGSVFRAIILACNLNTEQNIIEQFYNPVKFPETVVFDPFMGSGTTIGEAVKLGCRAIGRDINPVSVGMVSTALQRYSRQEVINTYNNLKDSVADKIQAFYKTQLKTGEDADVLYYFWVKVIICPFCGQPVELFKRRIFAKHATPRKHPEAKSLCPQCQAINNTTYNSTHTRCPDCGLSYNPQLGNVTMATTTCPVCNEKFKTIDAVRNMSHPPAHKMYAKIVLKRNGEKVYLPADYNDQISYERAEKLLPQLQQYIPQEAIKPGYNTNQVLNYNYTHWNQMFNARQLTTIALLASEIHKITNPDLRMLFAYLFSGTLEFNNMFCSFKGEGTGAVRHMFSHHILKPELMPLEANLWGTPKSSGAFSTLFESRILRLLNYKKSPFELKLTQSNGHLKSEKIFKASVDINTDISETYADFQENSKSVYLSCGDSSQTDIPDKSVDFVITDPPFFDNVHYSQLADFFYVWLRRIINEKDYFRNTSTRSIQEVQDTDAESFAHKLTAVFHECYRVLKDTGLLIFTYHHSRVEGWAAIYKAVREAGFYITHTHPVKAEMTVSIPIQQAKSPVNFDLVIVCQKTEPNVISENTETLISLSLKKTKATINKLQEADIKIGLGDIKVMLMGNILANLATIKKLETELLTIYNLEDKINGLTKELQAETRLKDKKEQPLTTTRKNKSTVYNQGRLWE